MRIHTLAAILLLSALAGCQSQEPAAASLELACQVRKCTCVGDRQSLISPKPSTAVLWTERGEAYCPEGYVLELKQTQSKDWLRNYGG